jgi:hypothetical protein
MSKSKSTAFTPPTADDLAAKTSTTPPFASGANSDGQCEGATEQTLPEQYEERRVQIITELALQRVEVEKRMQANHEGIKVARGEMYRASDQQLHGKASDLEAKIQQATGAIRADERLLIELEAQRVQVANGNHPELHKITHEMRVKAQSAQADALQKAQAEFVEALNSPEFLKAATTYVEAFRSVHPLASSELPIRFEALPFLQRNVTLAEIILAAAE